MDKSEPHRPTRKGKIWRIKKAAKVLNIFRHRKTHPGSPLKQLHHTNTADEEILTQEHLRFDRIPSSWEVPEAKEPSSFDATQRLSPVFEHTEKDSPLIPTVDSQKPGDGHTMALQPHWAQLDLAKYIVDILHGLEDLDLTTSDPESISPDRKACQDLYVQLVLASSPGETAALIEETEDPTVVLGALIIILSKLSSPLIPTPPNTHTNPLSDRQGPASQNALELLTAICNLLTAKCDYAHLQQWCAAVAPALYQSTDGVQAGEAFFRHLQRTTTACSPSQTIPQPPKPFLAYAILNFEPERETDLKLSVGDVLEVSERYDDGWWYGKNARSAKEGEFPSNFCIQTSAAELCKISQVCNEILTAALERESNGDLLEALYRLLAYRLSPKPIPTN